MRIATIFILFWSGLSFLQAQQLAVINDPDGYTNVRNSSSTQSRTVFRILEGEYFHVEGVEGGKSWRQVTNMDGKKGYMHSSRIHILKSFKVGIYAYSTQKYNLKVRTQTVGKTEVKIYQISSKLNGTGSFNCRGRIEITSPEGKKKVIKFDEMEANGGYSGLAFVKESFPDHLIVAKYGDYEDVSYVIHASGVVLEIGGHILQVPNTLYLAGFHGCDIGYCGFSVYDLKTNQIVWEERDIDLQGLQMHEGKFYGNMEDVEFFQIDFMKFEIKKLPIQEEIQYPYFKDFLPLQLGKDCLCY